jgi:hypothetical protein
MTDDRIVIGIDSGGVVRDALRDGVPLDQLHHRPCDGCGADLYIDEETLADLAGYIVPRYGGVVRTAFLCAPCARRAEGMR